MIELSIVLVIIGLIVGGIVTGRELIVSAAIRSQLAQMDRYQQAVNVFRVKYDALPGDMDAATATKFGFKARGTLRGEGDGNGILEGGNAFGYKGVSIFTGELGAFWEDLTYANGLRINLIPESFKLGDPTSGPVSQTASDVIGYMPPAKIGGSNYIYVYTPGYCCGWVNTNPVNFFGLSLVTGSNSAGDAYTGPGLSVLQAYKIDEKVDDGLPQKGTVTAVYAGINGVSTSPNAAAASASTCFDTTSGQYSITQNGGAGVNCGISFRFK